MLGRCQGKNQSTDVYEITCKSINNTLHLTSYKSYNHLTGENDLRTEFNLLTGENNLRTEFNLLTGENDLRTEFNLRTLVITTFHDDRFFGGAIGF